MKTFLFGILIGLLSPVILFVILIVAIQIYANPHISNSYKHLGW